MTVKPSVHFNPTLGKWEGYLYKALPYKGWGIRDTVRVTPFTPLPDPLSAMLDAHFALIETHCK